MTASLISSLSFSISPAKHKQRKDEDEEEEYILTLAPFTRPPKINFGTVKLNSFVERNLLIFNPQQFPVELNINSSELNINNIRLRVDQMENVNLKLKWQPDRVDYFKYSIFFEVTNSARLKFVVHAYGVCVKPDPKKISAARKPFAMLQPLKKEKTNVPTVSNTTEHTVLIQKPVAFNPVCMSTVTSNKENARNKPRMNTRMSEKYLRAKADDQQFANFYINEFNRDIPEEDEEEGEDDDLFDRRKTCIIKPAKVHKSADNLSRHLDLDDDLNQIVTSSARSIASTTIAKTPTIRRTSSVNDIDDSVRFSTLCESAIFMEQTIVHESPRTPKLSDFVRSPVTMTVIRQNQQQQTERRSLNQTITTNWANQTVVIVKSDEKVVPVVDKRAELVLKYVVMLQQAWRMKLFRRAVVNIKQTIATRQAELFLKYVVIVQRSWRMKMFRRGVLKMKEEIEIERQKEKELEHQLQVLKYTLKVQRAYRMKRFRRHLQECKQELMRKYTVMVQQQWRMIKFRKHLAQLQLEEKQRKYQADLLVQTVKCQQWLRYKRFRDSLQRLKQERDYQIKLNQCVIVCQQAYRYKMFKKNLLRLRLEKEEHERMLNRSATIIQKQWRMYKFRASMNKYRQSALVIQNWYRSFLHERIHYLRLKRYAVIIQQAYKIKYERRVHAAVKIQSMWRMYVQRSRFDTTRNSAIVIQKWYRSKEQRLQYIKLKRSLPVIQQKCRQMFKQRNESAVKIQQFYRYVRFRRAMSAYRSAAVTIQNWFKSSSYRQAHTNRIECAVKIQSSWRVYLARGKLNKLKEEFKLVQLHKSAIKIQSAWRGYSVRKQTEPMLQSIRQKPIIDSTTKACDVSLSKTYDAGNTSLCLAGTSTTGVTLGQRIRNSLQTLNQPYIALHQIVVSLSELDTVTRLSPECCHYFVRERAVNILYHFISNCNRSVPHQDLIKLCLQVFLNLAKYKNTCHDIIYDTGSANTKLNVLLTLLQSYQASNPVIFVHVCVILIVLANNADTKQILLKQESCVMKKLESIASLLERRSQLRSKHTAPGKESKFMTFNLLPDWTLSSTLSLKFSDQLQAINHLIKTLSSKSVVVHSVAKKPATAKAPVKVEIKKPSVPTRPTVPTLRKPVAPPKPQATRPVRQVIKRATSTNAISSSINKTQPAKPLRTGIKRTASMATISSTAKSIKSTAASIKKTRSVLGVNTIGAHKTTTTQPMKRTASTTFIQPSVSTSTRMATRSSTNLAKKQKPPVVERNQPVIDPSYISISSNDTTYHSVNSSIKSVSNLRSQKPRLNSTIIKKSWV